jgi:hypothetical protein
MLDAGSCATAWRYRTGPGEADLIVAKNRNGPTTTVTVAFQGRASRIGLPRQTVILETDALEA